MLSYTKLFLGVLVNTNYTWLQVKIFILSQCFPGVCGTFSVFVVLRCEDQPLPPACLRAVGSRGASTACCAGQGFVKGWCCLGQPPACQPQCRRGAACPRPAWARCPARPFLTRGPSQGPGVRVLSLRSPASQQGSVHTPAPPLPSCRHPQFTSTHTMLLTQSSPAFRKFPGSCGPAREKRRRGAVLSPASGHPP